MTRFQRELTIAIAFVVAIGVIGFLLGGLPAVIFYAAGITALVTATLIGMVIKNWTDKGRK
jgi:uncharacterized membrane protein YadS